MLRAAVVRLLASLALLIPRASAVVIQRVTGFNQDGAEGRALFGDRDLDL